METETQFMQQAIEVAKSSAKLGNYPVGAIIVKDGLVLAQGYPTIVQGNDPTAHAEVNAIRAACKKLGTTDLLGCVLYSTHEPCPMCAAAAVWARMDGIVFGATIVDAREYARLHGSEEFTWRQIDVPCATILASGTPQLFCRGTVLRENCTALFQLVR